MGIGIKLAKLTEDERLLLGYKLDQLYQDRAMSRGIGQAKKLMAYIKSDRALDMGELNAQLKASLPNYMIPSSIRQLSEFPLLPNGKIDKKKLSRSKISYSTKEVHLPEGPVNQIQRQLIEIWKEVLKIESIGIHDNFFETGGDSISSIQIIAKARNAGLSLKPTYLFSYQTISELSLFVKLDKEIEGEYLHKVEGDIPLVPIQYWFFETHVFAPHYWNHVIAVTNLKSGSQNIWRSVIEELVSYHDALRLSFYQIDNKWQAKVLSESSFESFLFFELASLGKLEKQDKNIKEILRLNQENRKLESGGLFQGLYFDCGDVQDNKLYIIAHHLLIDVVSWNIIFNDLTKAVAQKTMNGHIRFNRKTASIKSWGEHLIEYAKSPTLQSEIKFWQLHVNSSFNFPTDFAINSRVFEERSVVVKKLAISDADLINRLELANRAYNTRTEDLLITALLIALRTWSGNSSLYMGLERHGRTLDNASIDVSNTVGWFTSFFTLNLKLEGNEDLGNNLKSIKEQLRSIPNHGIGYGILKYFSGGIGNQEGEILDPPLIFNYLGLQNDKFANSDITFQYALDESKDPRSERTYLMEINSYIFRGDLILDWGYTTDAYKAETVAELTTLFRKHFTILLDHCISLDKVKFTPSDFPEAEITQEDLDNLFEEI